MVSISNPLDGAVLTADKTIQIVVTASDASGIQAVEIYIDGTWLVRDTSAPYTANWNLRRASKGPHVIKARAIDNTGQVSEQSIGVTLK